jgi:hypothetical protein
VFGFRFTGAKLEKMKTENSPTKPSYLNERNAKIQTLGRIGKKTCSFLIGLLVICVLLVPWVPLTDAAFDELKEVFSEAELHNGWFRLKAEIALIWGCLWLLLMRKAFDQFAEGDVLCISNARNIRWMGAFCVASLIVNQIVLSADSTSAERIGELFTVEALEGAFLLALGWAFEQAVDIKTENDLTV